MSKICIFFPDLEKQNKAENRIQIFFFFVVTRDWWHPISPRIYIESASFLWNVVDYYAIELRNDIRIWTLK